MAQGYGGSALGGDKFLDPAPTPATRMTQGSQVAQALMRNEDATREADALVRELRSRLIGGWPESANGTTDKQTQPEALIPAVAYRLHGNANLLRDINEHLRAILAELS